MNKITQLMFVHKFSTTKFRTPFVSFPIYLNEENELIKIVKIK
jgi:hypothetical protein